MQENHRNGQDDSDMVETSKTFTITRVALNRHYFVSELQLAQARASDSTGRPSLGQS